MKIDIEGGERSVFEHAGDWSHRVPRIVTELHYDNAGEDVGEGAAPRSAPRRVSGSRVRRRLASGGRPVTVDCAVKLTYKKVRCNKKMD